MAMQEIIDKINSWSEFTDQEKERLHKYLELLKNEQIEFLEQYKQDTPQFFRNVLITQDLVEKGLADGTAETKDELAKHLEKMVDEL